MLTTHGGASGDVGAKPAWIDLFNPTADEMARVGTDTGIRVPLRESLQEIETSSRLRTDGQVLYLSMPLALQDEATGFMPIPLGFILSPQLLITVRFSEVHAFAHVQESCKTGTEVGSTAVFAALIEGMVDFAADRLEKLSSELAHVSVRAFDPRMASLKAAKPASHALRKSLSEVGVAGDHLSRIRESVLGLQRIIAYVSKTAVDWLGPELKARLSTAQQDLSSLVDFESHLSGKTQFLLDAILGFINTEQNEIFKVLTIVSVVGIPPTLIASMYGMNFHDMPELSWRWGYPYGLALIGLSILLPVLWFKRRGWW
jgi:magnesium transporter